MIAKWPSVGRGAVCGDIIENLNAILKWAYNDHTARGAGGIAGGRITRKEGGGGFASMGVVVF